MKRKISIVISLIVIFITAVNVTGLSWKESNVPLAQKGEMDLSSWSFDKKNHVQLDGEWEFYPDVFIEPNKEEDVFAPYAESMIYVQVPGPWNQYLLDEPKSDRFGTYRLRLKVPFDATYSIKTNKIHYANRSYLNGYFSGSSGVASDDLTTYKANIGMYIGAAPSEEKQMEIVFHVASYRYPTGGIVNSVDFGTIESIVNLRDKERAKDALLIGGYIAISFMFFFLYVKERNNRFFLFFSLLTLSVCIHLSLLNERILDLVFPNIGSPTRLNLQISFIHIAVLSFLWFAHSFFKGISNRKTMIIISIIVGLQTSIYVFPFVKALLAWDMIPMFYKRISIVALPGIACFYVLFILIKAFFQKKEETEYVLVIVTTFLCYGFLISADFLSNIPVGHVPVTLFTVMLLFLALLMRSRSERTSNYIRQLSNNLIVQDRIKDEFLAKASTQLEKPLQKIKHMTQALMEDKDAGLKHDHYEKVMLIYRISQRLEYISADLLNASEIKKGNITMAPKVVSVHVLQHVVEEMKLFVNHAQEVEIIYDVPADFPHVYVDEQRLKQIAFNVLQNAVHYTQVGTITITADAKDGEAHISIIDTGVGIAPEELENIFTSFYQGENVDEGSGGLGLGLAIAKQLVELSGGKLSVTSRLGVGSTFIFTIPLVTEVIEYESLRQENVKKDDIMAFPYEVTRSSDHTLLLVSNDKHGNAELMDILQATDCTIISTNTGKSVLDIIDKRKIDLLIIDASLPDMSTKELCGMIRDTYSMIEIPILKLITVGQLAKLDVLSKNDAEMFLKKPVDSLELIESVDSLLAMKASSEQSLHDELSFFYAQIIPHFLYNTLNTIISLTYVDHEKSREALQHLAVYFRAKLNFYKKDEMIDLEKELALVASYTEIEKMRFSDIEIEFQVDESIHIQIPPLTLQPLVENAIEHGLMKRSEGGKLSISVKEINGMVEIVIEDDGAGMTEEKRMELLTGKSAGIGFANVLTRLKLIKDMSFVLESEQGKGTKITILIPNEKDEAQVF